MKYRTKPSDVTDNQVARVYQQLIIQNFKRPKGTCF